MSELDAQIDELYALPLAAFTESRNALAKRLKGDAAAVARVKKLAKPAQVPWAVNLLYWKERRTWERLLSSGRALRQAQLTALEGGPSDIRHAAAEHRSALTDAVGTATQLATGGGGNPPADPLSHMLEALSLAPEPATQVGRFTDLIQPAGFEALAGITALLQTTSEAQAAWPRGLVRQPPPSSTRSDAAVAQARARQAEALRRRAVAAVELARQQLARAEASTALAHAQVESASLQLERARFALSASRENEGRLRADLERAESALAAHEAPPLEAESRGPE